MNAAALAGLLAEPARLQVVSALVLGATTSEEIRTATGLPPRAVATALGKLQAGGLVDDSLRVQSELFREAARSSAPVPPTDVLSRFVRDGTLKSFPAHQATRLRVLETVAQSFEPGRRYVEKAVNEVLRGWTDGGAADHVTLRRYLVDWRLLAREGGEYWRAGGAVEV